MRFAPTLPTTLILVVCICACNEESGQKTPGDAQAGDGGIVDSGPGDGQTDGSPNAAKVFEINPVRTPDPAHVTLHDVADDVGGVLTSAEDEQGIRKLRVFTCVDEGETVWIMGVGEQRVCTLRQLANKNRNGNFIYEDWEEDVSGRFNPEDVHAEVSLYYHARKIYRFIISPEVGVFDHLPGRHMVHGNPAPVNLVANYRLPVPVGNGGLAPATVAFFVPWEYMEMGMASFTGLLGYDGDFLAFGQAPHMDFAYDGETVYHEFGHAINNATAGLEGTTPDRYGLTNLGSALDEGLADTFAFLVSMNPILFEYLDHHQGGGFIRDARADRRFPRDLTGLTVHDGNIISAANWEVLTYLKAEAGFDEARFARVLLRTLTRLATATTWTTFQQYADAFLHVLDDEGYAQHHNAVRQFVAGDRIWTRKRHRMLIH